MEALGSTRSIEITRLAMDGLIARQKAITANTANVLTPDYQRKEVAFEDQLQGILKNEYEKDNIKLANSVALSFHATSMDEIKRPTAQQLAFASQNSYNAYSPEVVSDMSEANPETGNNVNIETEMMDMAKAGTQFNIMATLEARMFSGLSEVIKGTGG